MADVPLRQRRLASALTQLRNQAELTPRQAGENARVAHSTVTRTEALGVRPTGDTVYQLCQAYGADEQTTNQLVQLARAVKRGDTGSWHLYPREVVGPIADLLELGGDAAEWMQFDESLMPGPLQTPDYARAVIRADKPDDSDEVVQKLVDVRLERQRRHEKLRRLWVVIDELALLRRVGSPKVMDEQFGHLLKMAERPDVNIQVLPQDTPEHPSLGVSFSLVTLADDDAQYVWLDSLVGGTATDAAADVRRYREAWERLTALALSFRDSAALIDRYRSRSS